MSIQSVLESSKARWHTRPAVEGFAEIDVLESRVDVRLPADYKYFMQFFSNGAEGDFDEMYIQVLPVDQVIEGFTLPAEMRQYLVFALDGDDAFAFDLSRVRASADYPVARFSLSSRDPDEVEYVATSFEHLLRLLADGSPLATGPKPHFTNG